ncbi:MAG: hypothetical protein ACOX6U_09270 [Oscillospiraceae bacterium]|jgi:hypothetical protein
MKAKKCIIWSAFAAILVGVGIWTASTAPKQSKPESHTEPIMSDTEPEPHPTVPLPRLVEYYQEQLDPDIPKITVTARVYGDGYAADLHLPYDGVIRATEKSAELDANQTWFVNLMNNFWSLPKLHDEYNHYLKSEMTPSHISIRFNEQPTGKIMVRDYGIFDSSGEATSTTLNGASYQKIPIPVQGELSFDLWEYEGIGSLSTQPALRGLLIQCEYNEKLVEYFILFQADYPWSGFYTADFSHLTPLEA